MSPVNVFGKTSKCKSRSPYRPINLPNSLVGSPCAFQIILLIERIPFLGKSHKNCTKRYSSFLGYNGKKSFIHFQYPHTCSYTQAFLHRHEDY